MYSQNSQYIIDDPFISNKHFRIYTIVFDRDNLGEVAPLVYAQDLSMNGTTWNGYEMGKGSGSFLLSHGDILQLTPDTYLRFQNQDKKEKNGFDMLQTVEMKVSPNILTNSAGGMQFYSYWEKGISREICYYAMQTRLWSIRKGAHGIQQREWPAVCV